MGGIESPLGQPESGGGRTQDFDEFGIGVGDGFDQAFSPFA